MDTQLLQKVEDYPESFPVYVHCGDFSQFTDYQKTHPTRTCVMIEDGVTLRGRVPGIIVRYKEFYAHPNHQEIEESIDLYWEEWKDILETAKTDSELGDKSEGFGDYGV